MEIRLARHGGHIAIVTIDNQPRLNAMTRTMLAELLRWWCEGKLKPLIAKTFLLAEASEALNALLSRRYAGKVVLET